MQLAGYIKKKYLCIKNKSFSPHYFLINEYEPPVLYDFLKYNKVKNLGLSDIDVEHCYNYFSALGWVDKKGKKVTNWKLRLVNWARNKKRYLKKDNIQNWIKEQIPGLYEE